MHSKTHPTLAGSLVVAAFAALSASAHADEDFKFEMVRSPSLAAFPGCAPNAHATVRIEPRGAVEEMQVRVEGLPPKTDFDFFVIQAPNGPFGIAWYQGDIETNEQALATASSSVASMKRRSSSRQAACRLLRCTATPSRMRR